MPTNRDIHTALIEWYKVNHRDLLFRQSRDPYRIWVSEVMAQQTKIDVMLPYYERWIEKWPTVVDLANAPLEEVLLMWQGLGYYNRARSLHKGAMMVCETFGGFLPRTKQQLLTIPGIGDYTSGAICSICYDQEEAAVDGNVLRVVTRILMLSEDITTISCKKKVTETVMMWMKDGVASLFNQAMMELGALVCTVTNPQCHECPLSFACKGYQHQQMNNFPIKKRKKKSPEFSFYTYLIHTDDEVCLCSDWRDGLMIGYYRLIQSSTKLGYAGIVKKKYKHIYSHRVWNMELIDVKLEKKIDIDDAFWVSKSSLESTLIISAHRKMLNDYNDDIIE